MKNLSVIIPVYNEEDNILPLYQSLKNNLQFTKDYEIIFVNDGSTDNTLKNLRKIKDDCIKVINFRKNLGQSSALTAGFHAITGEKVITMDGDLQNDPSDIKNLLIKLDEGYDMACGWRYERKDSLLIKKIPSRIFNFLIKIILDTSVKDASCTLRAYTYEVVKNLNLKKGEHRFIPVILKKEGFSTTNVKVKHNIRYSGKPKYNSPLRFFEGIITLVKIKLGRYY